MRATSGDAHSFDVIRRDADHAGEPRVLTEIVQIGRLGGAGVEQRSGLGLVGRRPVLVLLGPFRVLFHDERFAVRIEGVGHRARLLDLVLRLDGSTLGAEVYIDV